MKIMRRHKFLLALLLQVFLIGVFMCPAVATSASPEETGKVVLYFFWGDGCPHCAKEEIYLDMAKKKYPQLEVKSYEVWHNRTNAIFLSRMLEAAGIKSTGVPVTFIHTEVFAGFNDRTAQEIENKIQYCIQNKKACVDPSERPRSPVSQDKHQIVKVPFLGDIDLSAISLPVMTVILGGLDSFNPCAFFVLFFLLSLLIHAKSRKRMFLIGGTFVFFSGFIYFVFMAAWLNLFIIAGQLLIITVIAGHYCPDSSCHKHQGLFLFLKRSFSVHPRKGKAEAV